ncbi:hypothetical protein NOVOSPHI9U_420071 [Novosphingobium sp. 9U]|nr:hypothetical protein NOVOSPHI9U_420071 [Novosphingobium sp. 9U]
MSIATNTGAIAADVDMTMTIGAIIETGTVVAAVTNRAAGTVATAPAAIPSGVTTAASASAADARH